MKKKMISALLIGAMAVSMAAGCGQNDTNDANGTSAGAEQTTAQEDSNQILFNGSSTLAPVITSIATDFFDTYKTWNAYDSSLPERGYCNLCISRRFRTGNKIRYRRNFHIRNGGKKCKR